MWIVYRMYTSIVTVWQQLMGLLWCLRGSFIKLPPNVFIYNFYQQSHTDIQSIFAKFHEIQYIWRMKNIDSFVTLLRERSSWNLTFCTQWGRTTLSVDYYYHIVPYSFCAYASACVCVYVFDGFAWKTWTRWKPVWFLRKINSVTKR